MGFETLLGFIFIALAVVIKISMMVADAGVFDRVAGKFTRYVVTRIERLEGLGI